MEFPDNVDAPSPRLIAHSYDFGALQRAMQHCEAGLRTRAQKTLVPDA